MFNFSLYAENYIKIIYDVGDDIITNVDIKNQYKYLLLVDENFNKLSEDKGLFIAKEEALKDKIKANEIKKNFKFGDNNKLIDQIIKDYFKRLNITSDDQLIALIKSFGLTQNYLRQKFEIDTLWKELIFFKFNNKIFIDEVKIKDKIKKDILSTKKSFLLSEILFELKDNENLKQKFKIIQKDITKNGFDASASLFSISSSSKQGGKIGWINENQLSKEILRNITQLKIDEITNPIKVSSGFIILKVNDVKKVTQSKDINKEFDKIVSYERNRKLNEYSNIFYKKLKINTFINER
jgi:peptidyl-prolyl cis-trans isomerase SurA